MSAEAGPLTIDVRELQQVLNALLDQVQRNEGRFVDINRDHYWLLELSAAFSEVLHTPGTEPDDLGAGQISDDVATIHQLASELESSEAVLTPWHDLEHAIGLLRALAWKDLPS